MWDTIQDERPTIADYAEIWRSTDKIVYSSTLESVSTARTRVERTFDPEAVAALLASADRDLSIGGPTLAARAIAAGLVEEWHLFLFPRRRGRRDERVPRRHVRRAHAGRRTAILERYGVPALSHRALIRPT